MTHNRNLAIGKIRTSFGVKGYMKVQNFSGETEHFFRLEEISLENGKLREKKRIESVSIHGSDLILKFEGIDSPEEARKYIDWEIWVPRSMASSLGEGEYYIADLCGCTLTGISHGETAGGTKVYGKVRSVLYESGTCDYLEIESEETDEKNKKKIFLVPFRKEFIGRVDTESRTIELLADWIIP